MLAAGLCGLCRATPVFLRPDDDLYVQWYGKKHPGMEGCDMGDHAVDESGVRGEDLPPEIATRYLPSDLMNRRETPDNN